MWVIGWTLLIAHSVDLLSMLIISYDIDIIACLMSSGGRLCSCFNLLRMWVDDRIRLIIRPLPLLIFIIEIATKILGSWTYTSVVQASVEITGESTNTANHCIVFATIPSDVAAN